MEQKKPMDPAILAATMRKLNQRGIKSDVEGSYTGTAAGALLLIVLSNGLAVLQVTDSVKNMIMGIVLIVLLAAYNRAKPVRQ